MRIALTLLFLTSLVACGPAAPPDTPEERAVLAKELARLSIDAGSLERTLDEGAELARAYSTETIEVELERTLSDEEKERVLSILRAVLAEFLTAEEWGRILSTTFTEDFTAPELAQIREFYRSPVGKKILRLESDLAQRIDDHTNEVLEERLDAFVTRIDEELGKAFPGLASGEEG